VGGHIRLANELHVQLSPRTSAVRGARRDKPFIMAQRPAPRMSRRGDLSSPWWRLSLSPPPRACVCRLSPWCNCTQWMTLGKRWSTDDWSRCATVGQTARLADTVSDRFFTIFPYTRNRMLSTFSESRNWNFLSLGIVENHNRFLYAATWRIASRYHTLFPSDSVLPQTNHDSHHPLLTYLRVRYGTNVVYVCPSLRLSHA